MQTDNVAQATVRFSVLTQKKPDVSHDIGPCCKVPQVQRLSRASSLHGNRIGRHATEIALTNQAFTKSFFVSFLFSIRKHQNASSS